MPNAERFDIEIAGENSSRSAFATLKSDALSAKSAIETLNNVSGAFSAGGAKGLTDTLGKLGGLGALGGIGVAVGLLGGLGLAAYKAHQALTTLGDNPAIDELSRSMQMAALDGGELEEIFKANGKTLTDLRGNAKDVASGFRDVASMIQNAGSEIERMRIATDAFGNEAAPEMVRQIMAGVDSLDKLRGKGAEAFDPLKTKAQEFDTIMRSLTASTGGWISTLVDGLKQKAAPILQNVYDNLTLIMARLGNGSAQQQVALDPRNKSSVFAGGNTLMQSGTSAADDFYNAVGFGKTKGLSRRPPPAEAPRESQDRSDEVIRRLQLEGEQLTTNLDIRRNAEREEAKIVAIRHAGVDATVEEKAAISGAVDALYAKKKAWDDLQFKVRGYNDALQAGGNLLVDSLDGLITRTKTWNDVLNNTVDMLRKALLQAAILGSGPLAGVLGLSNRDGNTGGGLGALFGSFLGRTAHTGATVGHGGGTMRGVSGLAVAMAPRMHAGGQVGSDERVIVGKVGEEVGWPDQLARKYGGSGANIEIHNYSGAPASAERGNGPNGQELIRVVIGEVGKHMGSGGYDPIMRGRYGLGVPQVSR